MIVNKIRLGKEKDAQKHELRATALGYEPERGCCPARTGDGAG